MFGDGKLHVSIWIKMHFKVRRPGSNLRVDFYFHFFKIMIEIISFTAVLLLTRVIGTAANLPSHR